MEGDLRLRWRPGCYPTAQSITDNDNIVYELHTFEVFKFTYFDAIEIKTQLDHWYTTEKGEWLQEHGHGVTICTWDDEALGRKPWTMCAYVLPKRWTEYCIKFS